MWASVASRWEEHADDVEVRAQDLTDAILAAAGLRGGERVLELACGPGGAGLAVAARLGELGAGGEVVLSDVVPEMVEIARRRVAASGAEQLVRCEVRDLEAIDESDGSFDVVVCREGLMFAVEPAAAVGEVRRVLRPGGRAVVSVWGARARNPWLGLLLDAVSAEVGIPIPPPGIPGPFALGDDGLLHDLLVAVGFDGVDVAEVDVPLVAPSFDRWWHRTTAVAGPVAGILAGLPPDRRARIEAAVRDAVDDHTDADGSLRLPGVALLARGTVPAPPH
jgi:ubiquinone/menaquinone biosynthesis C-methylase UbiE